MAKNQSSRLSRLAALEAKQPQQPDHWVSIYDLATGLPLNGDVPKAAKVTIHIPHNNREAVQVER